MEFTAETMSRLLGNMATDADAKQFAAYLRNTGWELEMIEEQICASRDGEDMTEDEWLQALKTCFTEPMLMNPHTGSVAPESEWRHDFASMSAEEWGGDNFEDADLVEVVPNRVDMPGFDPQYGEWREAK